MYLTQHKVSREYFALKVMSQEGIIAQRQLERVFNEKKIHTLLSERHSYQVVKLYRTFKDTSNVYLVMDYQPADLFSLLNQMSNHVRRVRFLFFVRALTGARRSCPSRVRFLHA